MKWKLASLIAMVTHLLAWWLDPQPVTHKWITVGICLAVELVLAVFIYLMIWGRVERVGQ